MPSAGSCQKSIGQRGSRNDVRFGNRGPVHRFFLGSLTAMAIVGAYIVLNVLYCFKLKQIAILDVFIISMGFVLRLF